MESKIHLPQAGDEAFAEAKDLCGQCKYFELSHGQAQMTAQQFVARLVQEQDWKVEHLCSPLNQLGICGAADAGTGGDQTITGTMHVGCDQFRPKNGGFSLRKAAEL